MQLNSLSTSALKKNFQQFKILHNINEANMSTQKNDTLLNKFNHIKCKL